MTGGVEGDRPACTTLGRKAGDTPRPVFRARGARPLSQRPRRCLEALAYARSPSPPIPASTATSRARTVSQACGTLITASNASDWFTMAWR